MNLPLDIDDALGVEKLRASFLVYTRQAYALIPAFAQPHILDIGCGSGLPTIELAYLSDGEVVGIDRDVAAVAKLQQRLKEIGLDHRVKAVNSSLYDTGFANGSFDVLWAEGVLHLLDPAKSLNSCHRLLRSRGFLIMHETIAWFGKISERLPAFGFKVSGRLLLPKRSWWTNYYALLETSIHTLKLRQDDRVNLERLAQYEREIAMVKAEPERFDCGFFILQKGRSDSTG